MVRIAAITLSIAAIGIVDDAAMAVEPGAPSAVNVDAGLREIATVTVQRSAERLGRPGGFYRTPKFHIPLPSSLDKAVAVLAANYETSLSVAVEQAINRAAESSAQSAGDYLSNLVPKLALADPDAILRGPSDAVTAAVKAQTEQAFREAMRPIVRANLAKAEASVALERMQSRYEDIANVPFVGFDIETYTLESFASAFFAAMAQEEQNIRSRPSARSTETLKQLFSDQ